MLTVRGRMYKDIKDFCSRNKLDVCYDTVIRKTKGKSIPEKKENFGIFVRVQCHPLGY